MPKLKAKDGIRSVSVGGKEYTADKKGFINVPDEFVPAVLDAGFVVAEGDPSEAPAAGNDSVAGGAGDDTAGGSEQLA